ncbi:septation protein A [Rhizobium sp. L1K21]|uniref:septation protein A n=1 Tax=Rhizobium sp. L1K21 TaxID=2954933 RepID=UPI002094006A|nr:septation protein A [Rhizobium sp. L1K21]MCO6188082.1 septation protein A [Rhizobium sp. L1K21]
MAEANNTEVKPKENGLLKFVLELGPIIVFFFANLRGEWLEKTFPPLSELGGPLFVATAFFMVATVLSLVVSKIVFKHLPLMPLVSCGIVLAFGGLGIYLHNELFIKMKPTIINAIFGTVLLGGLFFGKSLLGYVFNSAFNLDDEGWRKLTFRWGIFFFFLAILNEVVWRNFSDEAWISFKLWGTMPITILFTMLQMPMIMRHTVEEPENAAE